MTTSITEKVREFQAGFIELYELTDNYYIQRLLRSSDLRRKVAVVVYAIECSTKPTFSMTEVEELIAVIKAGGTEEDIPWSVSRRMMVAEKSVQLLELYASLLKVPREVSSDGSSSTILWAKARKIDELTA